MLLRLRWMALGIAIALWIGTAAVTRLTRQRLSSGSLLREAARVTADGLGSAAGRLRGAPTP